MGGDNVSAQLKVDEIGYWSEVKLDIIRRYAAAYSKILSKQGGLYHVYIDGFAGAGEHLRKGTSEKVAGSPLQALTVAPPFREFFFIDSDPSKVAHLRRLAGDRTDVHILAGDCNEVLLKDVFPQVRWEDYRRGLCLLDPYGLDLRWEVIETAGRLGSIDLFLNFPIMDANRNALWRDPARVSEAQAARLTAYWGDESWKEIAYRPARQMGLFGDDREKVENDVIAEAFRERLQVTAGFANVPQPMPMHIPQGPIVYYLFFASQKDVANKIVKDIFRKHASRRR